MRSSPASSVIAEIVIFPWAFFRADTGLRIPPWLIGFGLLIPVNSLAFLELGIENTQGLGWQIQGLEIGLQENAAGQEQLTIRAGQIKQIEGLELSQVSIHCPTYTLNSFRIECRQGQIAAQHADQGKLTGRLDLSYHLEQQTLSFELQNFQLAAAQWQLEYRQQGSRWSAQIQVEAVELTQLKELLAGWITELPEHELSSGRLNLKASISGQDGELQQVALDSSIQNLGISVQHQSSSGQSEELGLQLKLNAEKKGQDWFAQGDVHLTQGLAYIEPGFTIGAIAPGFYLEFPQRPLNMAFELVWLPEGDALQIKRLLLEQDKVMRVSSQGLVSMGSTALLQDMQFSVSAPSLPRFYTQWLQPLLLDTLFSKLQTSGGIEMELGIQADVIRDLSLKFSDVFLEDEQGRFNLYGLDGAAILNSGSERLESDLNWQGAGIHRLDLGAVSLAMESSEGSISLRREADIPILDGVLKIDALRLDKPGTADQEFYLDGLLTPISLEAFSHAMDWPIMAGKLSGIIPGLRYAKHRLTMDGNLLVRAFEGVIPIHHLEVRDLFGQVPRLSADIEMRKVNLETLTSTFSFGKITGLLSGHIKDLELEAWQPVSFDAAFRNPQDDDLPHRISRRAVDDLTSIGGGIPTLELSSRFIRVFDEFSYGELGLSCRLRQGVCEMGGVSETPDSYDILTHGLFPPWIQIKGINRRVNWPVLVERLQDIVAGEGPIIE